MAPGWLVPGTTYTTIRSPGVVGNENATESEVFAAPLLSAVFFCTKLIAAEAGTPQHSRVNANDTHRMIDDKGLTMDPSCNTEASKSGCRIGAWPKRNFASAEAGQKPKAKTNGIKDAG